MHVGISPVLERALDSWLLGAQRSGGGGPYGFTNLTSDTFIITLGILRCSTLSDMWLESSHLLQDAR